MLNNNNVDPHEIEKFEAIAANWWDPEGDFKPLHQFNPIRLNYIMQRSNGLFNKKVLDVGCGGGILAESMAKEGAIVTGLDMGEKPLQVARLHALESKVSITYLQQTVEAHAQQHAGEYDVVTCMEMLEHVPDPASIINACAQLVKPGGDVFFSTINRNIKAWLLLVVGAEYVLNMLPKGTHELSKFIRPSELMDWIDQTSLNSQHITGIRYNPFSGKFKFTSNVDVNYILHTRRIAYVE